MDISIKRLLLLEAKGKQSRLQKKLVQLYSWEIVYNQEKHFDPTVEDLQKLYAIVNEIIFDSKLPEKAILEIDNNMSCKGSFGYQKIDEGGNISLIGTPPIKIKKEATDSFLEIIDVLGHEMIHYYDLKFGPLRECATQIIISTEDGKQLIGDYDSHGKYFQSWVEKFFDEGFYVSINHNHAMRYLMIDDFSRPLNLNGTSNYTEAEVQESKIKQLEIQPTDSKIVKFAKTLFKTIKTDGYFGVEVKGNKCYVIME